MSEFDVSKYLREATDQQVPTYAGRLFLGSQTPQTALNTVCRGSDMTPSLRAKVHVVDVKIDGQELTRHVVFDNACKTDNRLLLQWQLYENIKKDVIHAEEIARLLKENVRLQAEIVRLSN